MSPYHLTDKRTKKNLKRNKKRNKRRNSILRTTKGMITVPRQATDSKVEVGDPLTLLPARLACNMRMTSLPEIIIIIMIMVNRRTMRSLSHLARSKGPKLPLNRRRGWVLTPL